MKGMNAVYFYSRLDVFSRVSMLKRGNGERGEGGRGGRHGEGGSDGSCVCSPVASICVL